MKTNFCDQGKEKKTLGLSVSIVFIALSVILTTQLHAQIQTNVPSLKNVYANDFYIGCILSYRHVGFPSDSAVTGQSSVVDPNGGYLVKYHMNSMSPGNNMKLQYTVDIATSAANYLAASGSARDSVNVHPVVRFNGDMIAQLNWARRQGFTFRGHNLVWHSSVPTEFFRTGYTTTGARLSKDSMTIRMGNYIHEVIRIIHQGWPGLLSAFDVVNEAIDDGTSSVRTTGNEWYTTFGDSTYVMLAFQFARQYTAEYGETQIKLYYNDYNTDIAAKANGIVTLLTPIFQAGYLDGIGMQEHDAISPSPFPTAANFIASYNKFSPICSEMSVTETDCVTGSATPSAAVLAKQANQYGMLFKCFVERSFRSGRGKIVNVTKDGLDDAYTFATGQSSSLWDSNDQCKPAFFAVADVGANYDMLDSLIRYADSLHQKDYSVASWAHLDSVLSTVVTARDQNYSASFSADTVMWNAFFSLQDAILALSAPTTVKANRSEVPAEFGLGQNYPNPFNPSTVISYQLPINSFVTMKVYDLVGREVRTLVSGWKNAGTYSIQFDASSLPSGVYFYRIQAGNFASVKKLILLK
ncbi:MAG TPA: endo-1,4-beta-xylanase [Bacteroidota bacterium]|nr:endo-1,4-beta-xylanase [Bacteroidota bacterium]